MRVALVAPSAVPFTVGGAEKLWWGLTTYDNRHTSHAMVIALAMASSTARVSPASTVSRLGPRAPSLTTSNHFLSLNSMAMYNCPTAPVCFPCRAVSGAFPNNKLKASIKGCYGFRTAKAITIMLYHKLGELPEPRLTHRFC